MTYLCEYCKIHTIIRHNGLFPQKEGIFHEKQSCQTGCPAGHLLCGPGGAGLWHHPGRQQQSGCISGHFPALRNQPDSEHFTRNLHHHRIYLLHSAADAVEQEIEAIRKKASEGITLKINTAKKEADEAKTKRDEILAAREARGFNEDDFAGSRTGSTKFKGKTMAQWTAEGSKKGASDSTKAEVAAAQEAIRLYEREKNALADLGAIIADREKKAK